MFPSFITSFQDQFIAVLINLVGTVLGAAFNAVFNSFVTYVLTPLFEQFAASPGAGA